MPFLEGLDDDTLALLGCAAALLCCGGLLWLSYYLGRLVRRPESTDPAEPHCLPLPSVAAARNLEHSTSRRRAA